MQADQTPSHSLQDFLVATAERDRPGTVFELESNRMLEVNVAGRTWAKLGSMVAYRGAVKFVREGALEGGMGKALKRFVTGEVVPLVKLEGNGKVYLADAGKHVTVLRLQGETLNVNGNDLLAFEDSITYDITTHRRIAGMLSGGLFSVKLTGNGMVALMSHGEPLTLRVTANDPVFTDPNATIAWSEHLSPELKTDISLRALIGRGGGETFQMQFRGEGFVVVQPYEEIPVVTTSSGGG